jgi:hypothetical protein
VEYARERNVDLILITVHGGRPGRREEQVFGTTADYVARNAHCWVWTVRRGASGQVSAIQCEAPGADRRKGER